MGCSLDLKLCSCINNLQFQTLNCTIFQATSVMLSKACPSTAES